MGQEFLSGLAGRLAWSLSGGSGQMSARVVRGSSGIPGSSQVAHSRGRGVGEAFFFMWPLHGTA